MDYDDADRYNDGYPDPKLTEEEEQSLKKEERGESEPTPRLSKPVSWEPIFTRQWFDKLIGL